eukprot:TRINITY_DN4726_c0_g1_i5.p2 TRINITY_DN4726_c0_g1~~TRINITY_DN4726_c0_g1_i5.p2  ORF type:complete len:256 (-),score=29.81 TRINITY_DN4726_c0_g1_i5:96-863(-)
MPLTPDDLHGLVTPEESDRWERLLLQKTLDSMSDVVYCPRCQCAVIEETGHIASCAPCHFVFCTLCLETYHGPSNPCMTPELQLEILRKRSQGLMSAGKELKIREKRLAEETMSLGMIRKISRSCPNCQMAIEKTEGCNKMTCSNCGGYFCYRCGEAISGYDHFTENRCVLFETREIDNWNRMMARMRPVREGPDRALMGQHPVKRCPSCGQRCAKQNTNNHMHCWACGAQFCFLCGVAIRGTRHFSAVTCRQHD